MGGRGSGSGRGRVGGGAGGASVGSSKTAYPSRVDQLVGKSEKELDFIDNYAAQMQRTGDPQFTQMRVAVAEARKINQAQKNPSSAPVGTKLTMGGYTYTKTKDDTWVTYGPTGKRVQNRKDADIKRVFM